MTQTNKDTKKLKELEKLYFEKIESYASCRVPLTQEQQEQVTKQLNLHQKSKEGLRKIILNTATGAALNLFIGREVFRSDKMSSAIELARFLYRNNSLYRGGNWLDMGCGAGTQGLVMALNGARRVDFSDSSSFAEENARYNINRLNLKNKSEFFLSDCFDRLPMERKYDGVVFNYPFFPEIPKNFGEGICTRALRGSMLGGTNIAPLFFKQARMLQPQAKIIVPYWIFAGKENEPLQYALQNRYCLIHLEKIMPLEGIQSKKGDISIYIFEQKKAGARA